MAEKSHPKPELLTAVRAEAYDLIDDAAHALANGGDPETAWYLRGIVDGLAGRDQEPPNSYVAPYKRGFASGRHEGFV